MPEAVVKITNKILHKGRLKELAASLELPTTREQIDQTLRELHVDGAGENGKMEVKWLDSNSYSFCELEWESRDINHIHEINYLAEQVAALDSIGRSKLNAMCSRHLDSMEFCASKSTEYEPSIAHAINLTHNLTDIKVIEGIGDIRQLGSYCVSKKISGFESLCGMNSRYLNYDSIGIDYCSQLGGSFYFGNYVYNLPSHDEMANPYDGKSLLIELEEEPEQICGITMGGM